MWYTKCGKLATVTGRRAVKKICFKFRVWDKIQDGSMLVVGDNPDSHAT